MVFKAVFLAHARDAESEKYGSLVETSMYKLFTIVVKNQVQAVEDCKKLIKEEGILSVMRCPGFTDKNVAKIAEAFGEHVGVAVERGDSPGRSVLTEVRIRAYFPK